MPDIISAVDTIDTRKIGAIGLPKLRAYTTQVRFANLGHPRERLELGRNRGSVTRDVNRLRQFGFGAAAGQVNPGHGVVQIVEPVARRLQMRIAL